MRPRRHEAALEAVDMKPTGLGEPHALPSKPDPHALHPMESGKIADPMGNGLPRQWVEGARHSTPTHVSEILRAARKARRWSYRQAAPHLGISASFLARIEQGTRAMSTATARRLAQAYGLDGEQTAAVVGAAVAGVGRSYRPAGQRESGVTDG